MKNILTIDCEDWYHTDSSQKYLPKYNITNPEETIHRNIPILLEMLKKNNTRATFFILGCIAEKYPELVIEIKKAGHRIGAHGYYHKNVFFQTKEEFEEDIIRVTRVLQRITSEPIQSFRAPNWSINKNCLWAIEILKKYGYKYDSSLTYMKRSYSSLMNDEIIEVARSSTKLININIPFGGGAFLRLYPLRLTKYLISKSHRKELPFMMYLHPWEIDNKLPKLAMSILDKTIQYGKINSFINKIAVILKEFNFVPLEDYFSKLEVN